jgi:hypothetical protein
MVENGLINLPKTLALQTLGFPQKIFGIGSGSLAFMFTIGLNELRFCFKRDKDINLKYIC